MSVLEKGIWAAAAVLFGGSPAHGAGPVAAEEDLRSLLPLSLEELIATPIVTASRRRESRAQTPAHIMVITREQIRDRRYKNLADLLEDLPGVDFQRGTRSTQYNNFVFQGHVSNNKLLILLDGVRIDNPTGGKIQVAENFSLYHARQVEVLYGPAAALYGADAFGGVINIISDRAGAPHGGKVAIGGGNFGSLAGDFLVGGDLGRGLAITVGAHDQRSDRASLDQYYPGDFPKVAARDSTGTVVVPAAQREGYVGGISSQSQYFRVDAGDDLTVGFYRNRFRNLSSTGDKTSTSLYLSSAFWDTTLDTWYGKYRFTLGSSLSGELVLDYSEYEVDPASRYVNKFTDFQNHGYDYSRSRRRGVEQNFNWRPDGDHAVLFGLGYRDYYAIETPDLPHPYNTGLGSQGQAMTYPNTNLPLRIFDASYFSWSGYLQWQAQWRPDLSTMVGVRKDWYSTYGGSLNPRVGVVWQPLAGNYLKLLYGEAFRAPSPEETFSAFGAFSGVQVAGIYQGSGLFRAPNLNLQPEKSRNLSLTWDWRPRKDFNLVANAYLTRVSNLIITRADPLPIQYIPGANLTATESKQNSGRDKYWGIDIIPQWQMRLGGAWSADWWGSYSFVRGRVQETLNGIEWDQTNIATHKLKLGVTLRYQDWLTVTPRLQWIGATNTGQKDPANPGQRLQTDPYAVASLHVGFHKLGGDRVSAYVDLYNLFDKRYSAAHGSSKDTLLAVPQQPRTVMGTIEYRF